MHILLIYVFYAFFIQYFHEIDEYILKKSTVSELSNLVPGFVTQRLKH